MSRFASYVRVAEQLVNDFDCSVPFHHYARAHFRQHAKFGSTDRKMILQLCYAWFRTAFAFKESFSTAIPKALWLTGNQPYPLLAALDETLNASVQKPVAEKLQALNLSPDKFFPFAEKLSAKLDAADFALSFFHQPDFFLRTRPGKHTRVTAALRDANIAFKPEGEAALRLTSGTNVEKALHMNRDAMVQDLSSQHTLDQIPAALAGIDHPEVWDCCAASGGKSILVYDHLEGKLRLHVSDIRASIVSNLRKRLGEARVPVQNIWVGNASEDTTHGPFHLVICDAPCTGSGTWARTPEQMHCFNDRKLDHYITLQQQILQGVHHQVKRGGYLLYITCSVFTSENEDQVNELLKTTSLKLTHSEYITGYHHKADTLFTALFKKE